MKYMDIKIFGIEKPVRVFENIEKTGNQPDFTGFGISVWAKESEIKEKK